ncbi:hypothetical protein [Desertibacillus haloalkaliphilus]|uniref:hypothetical protein n=1 Tax=Desertibacillus haloalkaliphilus TaxID=1328930 RepID=UPI001C27CAE2|nr:hypothetical protein [Desertibacillus haloalkaliphilus]MBU8905249.1 hypothetical protein [Desertibacillus haloalkaliphilus]
MSIFTDEIIDEILMDAKRRITTASIEKKELVQEVMMFNAAMQHVKGHPWNQITIDDILYDTTSSLYKKIHKQFVGDDPEEDYKDVLVWNVAKNLYVTAALDHDPTFAVKWDVVVYEEGQVL